VSRPQVIDDVEHERVWDVVAAVDVAKKDGVVCVRRPHPSEPGVRQSHVSSVPATVGAVAALGAELAGAGVQMVTLESTSDYWRIWYYVLEAAGVAVQLVSATQVKQVSGRPKTDKLDAVWLARLTEKGLLRPSFVPPAEIRALRHYARARTHLTGDRTRCWQRLEKLLEDALIKVSSVASKLTTLSVRDMIEAMIAGERDPQVLAGLARGRMKAKHAALVAALTGMFADHHAQIAQILLDQIAFLDGQVATLTTAIEDAIDAIPAAWGADPLGGTGTGAGTGPDAAALPAVMRLEEIPGVSAELACSIIAETGLDMTRFPTPGHLVSWAGLCPATLQSGPRTRHGKGQGNTYLRGYLGQAAAGAAGTATFLGERHARIARRRGGGRAQVAVARSILVIIWHVLADRGTRFADLGPGYYETKINNNRRARAHVRQLEALGYTVALTQAA
jgi:transposase